MCFLKLGVLCDLNSTKLECNILTLLLLYSNFEFEFLICVYLKKKIKNLVQTLLCLLYLCFGSFWYLYFQL